MPVLVGRQHNIVKPYASITALFILLLVASFIHLIGGELELEKFAVMANNREENVVKAVRESFYLHLRQFIDVDGVNLHRLAVD